MSFRTEVRDTRPGFYVSQPALDVIGDVVGEVLSKGNTVSEGLNAS